MVHAIWREEITLLVHGIILFSGMFFRLELFASGFRLLSFGAELSASGVWFLAVYFGILLGGSRHKARIPKGSLGRLSTKLWVCFLD